MTFLNGKIIKFGTFLAAANGIISSDEDGYKEKIYEYKDYLKREEAIRSALSGAEKEYYIYGEYI